MTGGAGGWLGLSVALGSAACCVPAWRRQRTVRRRAGTLLRVAHGRAASGGWQRRLHGRKLAGPGGDAVAALGAVACGIALVDGPGGWLAGALAGCGVWRLLRRRRMRAGAAGGERELRGSAAQLPLTAELLAACLAAGSGPGQAAEAVGRSLGGPLGRRLVRASTELRLGGEPAVVWRRFEAVPGIGGFARCMERAGTAGVPAVEPVTRLATELRAARGRAASARARRAAVLVTGPLGLCFLPAFLAVGVAPVVLGLASSLR